MTRVQRKKKRIRKRRSQRARLAAKRVQVAKATNRFELEAATGAKWWADLLRVGAVFQKPDGSERGKEAHQIRVTIRTALGATLPSQVDAFESNLKSLIQERLKKDGKLFITVYPGPDSTLMDAALGTGLQLDKSSFPGFTEMMFWPGRILAKTAPAVSFEDVEMLDVV